MSGASQIKLLEVPLTMMQQGMLYATLEAGPGAGVYIEQAVLRVTGDFNGTAFANAWQTLVSRHDCLRIQFHWRNRDHAMQSVAEAYSPQVERLDWSAIPRQSLERRWERFLAEDRAAGIELEGAPLHRITVVQLAGRAWRMVWSVHHAIIDGRGIAAVLREFLALYRAGCADAPQPELSHAGSFLEFARQEEECDWAEASAFWKGALVGVDEPTSLWLAPASGQAATYHEVSQWLDSGVTSQLIGIARETHTGMSTLVHAAWACVLHRYTGQQTVTFGVTRAMPGGALAGLHINTLPFAASHDRSTTLREWLAVLRAHWLAQRPHARTPLPYVQQWILGSGAKPLFDTYVVHERGTMERLVLGDEEPADVRVSLHERTPAPLTLAIYETDTLAIHLEHDTRLVSAAIARRMLDQFVRVLASLPHFLDRALAEIPFFSSEDLNALLPAPPPAPAFVPVHAAVSAWARKRPRASAIRGRNHTLDYASLERHTNQIAHALRARGVCPGDVVALMMPRCPEAIEAMIGVLKAGAAYLPIDPGVPEDRRAFKIADSAARLTVTLHADDWGGRTLALLDDGDFIGAHSEAPLTHTVQPTDPAYVIYTSGSTGLPKGVVVPHGALSAFVQGACRLYGITRKDRVLQFASFSFDAAAEEIYPTLVKGAALVLRNDEMIASAAGFVEQCREWKISVLDLPTAYWHVLVDSLERIEWPKHLRLVIIGGEAARPDKVAKWCGQPEPHPVLANTYGPTETTVAVTCAFLEGEVDEQSPVPIGKAFPYAATYVLDNHLEPAPKGAPGELYIGGAQLALGYLNRPEITRQAFVEAPWNRGLRLYRTGDRVFEREDGALLYLERVDRQVKLRGFRIELGEIEMVLQGTPGVRDAAVLLREDQPGMPLLCAYLVLEDAAAKETIARARQRTADALPPYMQPAQWVTLHSMPMTISGKVDRKALPSPAPSQASQFLRPPRSAMEERVHAIWCEVFRVPALSCDDEFLALGGHSLLATQIVTRIADEIGVELPLRVFLEHTTIAALSAYLEGAPSTAAQQVPRLPDGVVARLAPDQELLWVYERIFPGTRAYHIPVAFEISGPVEFGHLEAAIREIVARHDALRSTFRLVDGAPAIVVTEKVRLPWRLERVPSFDDEQARAWLTLEASQPFDIEAGPLLRCAVLSSEHGKHLICLTIHHLISDGWTVGVLTQEWSDAYAALARGARPTFAPLPLRYVDVAAWRIARGVTPDPEAEEFWRAQLAPPVPRFHWPAPVAAPEQALPQGALYPVSFPVHLSDALSEIARAQGATPFSVFLALFALSLNRYAGQQDSLIGFSLAARTRPEFEQMAGFFLATLLMRVNTEPEERFDAFVRNICQNLWRAQEHQEYPFARLRALDSGLHSDPSAPPLLQALLLMQSMSLPPLAIAGAETRTLNVDLGKALTDITLELYPSRNGYAGWIEYQTRLFSREDVARLAAFMVCLAERVVADPFVSLSALPAWEDVPVPAEIVPLAPLHTPAPPESIAMTCSDGQREDVRPPDETESRLLKLFERILRVQGLSVQDNFFEHNGHSLLVILLLDQIEQAFGERLAPVHVYQAPTARALARLIRNAGERPLERVVERIRPEGNLTPLFFVGSTDLAPPLLPYFEPGLPVYGLNIFGLLPDEGDVPELTVAGIAAAYVREIRRVQPQGPYRFVAYCRDTMLALEVAQQLYAAGETVERLIAVDFFWDSKPRHSKLVRHLRNLRDFGWEYAWEKLQEFRRQLQERRARLRARLAQRRQQQEADEATLAQNHRSAAFINAYYDAVHEYHVAAYPGHVHNILASEWGIQSLEEWDDLAQGGTTLHILKACHHNLWNMPQSQDLAALINACLADTPNPFIGKRPASGRAD